MKTGSALLLVMAIWSCARSADLPLPREADLINGGTVSTNPPPLARLIEKLLGLRQFQHSSEERRGIYETIGERARTGDDVFYTGLGRPPRTLPELARDRFDAPLFDALITNTTPTSRVDSEGFTPLHYAIRAARTNAIVALINRGAPLPATNNAGYTPLQYAFAVFGDFRLRGFRRHECDHTAFSRAWYSRFEIANILIASGAELDIFSVIALGHTNELERILLEAPASARVFDGGGRGTLYWALYHSHPEFLPILLKSGATARPPSHAMDTPLHLAARLRSTEITASLLQAGGLVNQVDANGQSALHVAAMTGNIGVLAVLENASGDSALRDRSGRTPPELLAELQERIRAAKAGKR